MEEKNINVSLYVVGLEMSRQKYEQGGFENTAIDAFEESFKNIIGAMMDEVRENPKKYIYFKSEERDIEKMEVNAYLSFGAGVRHPYLEREENE